MSEAFILQGLGNKKLPSQGTTADWVLQIPIGTYAIEARVDIVNRGSGIATANCLISILGPDVIADENVSDAGTLTLAGNAFGQLVLQGATATNQPAAVRLRCTHPGGTTGDVEFNGARITAYRLQDPDHLSVQKVDVQ